MTPITFLKERLELIALQFPGVQIKYAFNSLIQTHIVELTPPYEYYNNSDLDNAWIPLSLEFKEKFESADISFISSDSPLCITEPELIWNKKQVDLDLEFFNNILGIISDVQIVNIEFPELNEQLVGVRSFIDKTKSEKTVVKSYISHNTISAPTEKLVKQKDSCGNLLNVEELPQAA